MSHILENNNILKLTEELFLKEEHADVHFMFRDGDEIQKLAAHKFILSIQSPVFNAMFFGALMEKGDVAIVDATIDEFTEFLQFFYLKEVNITIENIEAVMRLANKYDFVDCVSACVAFLEKKLTPKDMCWGYQLAIHLNNESLIKFCEQQISLMAKEVFATDSFKCCSKEVLERILELPMPIDEIDVFKAALEWAKHACKLNDLDENNGINLKDQLGDCLKMIRFNDIYLQDVITLHASHAGLFTPTEFQEIILLLSINLYEPKIFKLTPRPKFNYVINTGKVLKCQRKTIKDDDNRWPGKEYVQFSSNKTLWLGAICLQNHIPFGQGINPFGQRTGMAVITINEINMQNPMREGHSKQILKFSSTYAPNLGFPSIQTEVFPSPVRIKPQNLYEICLTVEGYKDQLYYSTRNSNPIRLDDDTTIKFHESPLSIDGNTFGKGVISGFEFYRL